jgi:hypothetical protein
MSCSTNGVKIQPYNVTWIAEAGESWDFYGATASGLGGKYVTMYLPDGTGYYAWFDENNTDVDPAPSGLTEIEVDYAASATATAIATAFQTAVNAVTGFTATISGLVVTVERDDVGEVTDATIGSVTSGIELAICRRGKNYDLGLLQGDIELSAAPSNFELTAHQTGVSKLALLNQGFESVEITTVLLETNNSSIRDIYKIYGGAETPMAGTEVFGLGSGIIGKNMLIESARLRMRPVGASDGLNDITMMSAIPVPESMTLSGENPRTLSVTWTGFVDEAFNDKFNVLAFGDVDQAGL